MITLESPVSARPTSRSGADRWFYVSVTLFVILVNVAGFSPSLVNASARTVPLPLLVPRGTSVDPGTFLAPAGTLIPIGAFVGAAVWYRRRPAVHKRLMMLALLASTGAPIAHVVGHWPAFAPYVLTGGMVILFLPAIRDWVWERRIHPVSLWGAIVIMLWATVFLIVLPPTALWRNFAAGVVL